MNSQETVPGARLIEDLATKPLVFLDCEMTGAFRPHNRLLDIGFLKAFLKGLISVEEYESRVRVFPQDIRRASRKALRMVGYDDREWKRARPSKEVLMHVRAAVEGCIPVFWDAHCDLEILDDEAARQGLEPLILDGYIDLQRWAQARLDCNQPNLHMTADRFKIPYGRMHRGYDDAYVTYELCRMFWRFSKEEMLAIMPTLTWDSYRKLSGPIVLDESTTTERLLELLPHFVPRRQVFVSTRNDPMPHH